MIYVGQGFDVHALVEGRKLIIGGVNIPYKKGLKGHSDADVLIHAFCDALLGAMGEEDIGHHFPDTDLKYKNISSLILLDNVIDLMKKKNLSLINADLTIIAEQPKFRPYIPQMKSILLSHFPVNTQINIKATTTEHLGFTGREEGIAAMAIVSLKKNI